jgi:hypothetical protein
VTHCVLVGFSSLTFIIVCVFFMALRGSSMLYLLVHGKHGVR